MRLKRKAITEYPFHGTFYTVITKKPEDGDLLGNGGLLDGDLLGGEDTAGSINTETSEEPFFLKPNAIYSKLPRCSMAALSWLIIKCFSRAKLARSYLYVSIPILSARIMQYQSKAGL